jgi:hypothetical protein
MEGPVREAVECDHFQPPCVKIAAQPGGGAWVGGESRGDRCGEPQPDPEPVSGGEPAYHRRIAVELRHDLRQIFAGMDVGAVPEMDRLPVAMPQPHQTPPRRIELSAKVAS